MGTTSTDLLIFGSVITPETLLGGARAGFVALRGDRIVAVGSRGEGEKLVPAANRVIDLAGATITAGFVDAHIHPIAGFELTRGVDLSGLRTWDGVREAIRAHAATSPDGWVFGWGFEPTAFEDRPWSNAILDGVADDRLVQLTFFDAHAALVSDAAIVLAGITGQESFSDNGRVGVDDRGAPNGVLYEGSAQQLVRRFILEPTREERVSALSELLSGMAAAGLTGGHMLDLAILDSLEVLEELERRQDLPIRVRVSPWLMPGFDQSTLDGLAEMQGRHGRRWHVRGIKLMIDGTIDNGTAWLFEPDSEGESTQSLWLKPEEYVAALAFFDTREIPTTTHAIGDKGTSFVAAAIEKTASGRVRHRIEHIETLPDEVLSQIVAAGATASMQPTHCTHFVRSDGADNWSRRLGTDRAARGWRIRDLREAGVTVALGSDWPIAPYDPRGILASAQLRRRARESHETPINPEQAISAVRALEGYTSHYWRSIGEAGGEIVPGGRGDLTAFDLDPLIDDPDDFAGARVMLTVVDGEVVVEA